MLQLPSDHRFNPHRAAGADIPAAREMALNTIPIPPGTTTLVARRWLDGGVLRGTLGADGKRLTVFSIPKPLVEIYGPGKFGNPGTPGYAWGDGFLQCRPWTVNIVMDIDFVCADVAPAAHNMERGYNIVYVGEPTATLILINCGFYNADSALVLGGTHSHAFGCTVGVKGTKRVGKSGHYGVRCRDADNVLEQITIRPRFYHAISTQKTTRCVYKDIVCTDGQLDFHAWSGDEADDDNLYVTIDLGKQTESAFEMGGATAHRPWSGDRNTFYNIRAKGTSLPGSAYPSWLRAVRLTGVIA